MNCHQVLTGAVNSGDNCYSVGSVEGIPFVAYTSGCNVVIQSSGLQRVQIIAGILYGNIQVNCLDSSTDVGKIGAAYGHKIYIFEPTPLLQQVSAHRLDYKWIQTACIETDSHVSVISWNLEGNKLLTGGQTIRMWHLITQPVAEDIEIQTLKPESDETNVDQELAVGQWQCVWQCTTSTPVHFLRFSPDGTLFVSAGKSDRLVKIWYESAAKNNLIPKSLLGRAQENGCQQHIQQKLNASTASEVDFSFIYIAHPRGVTGISWRKVSKYLPRGSVANMLVTSCRDNICRLWVQTLLPEDGLVNLSQIEGLSNYVIPRAQTQRHRQKIMQRLKQMKSLSQFKKRQQATVDENQINGSANPIPTLPSTFSVHDFHSFGIHGTAMAPGLHFHLTASINAETDIPLVPSLSNNNGTDSTTKPSFVIHWLNNKEMFFTQSAEKILHEISLKIIQNESTLAQSDVGSDTGEADGPDTDETEGASITTAESNRKYRKPIPQTTKKSSKHFNKALSHDEVEHDDSHPAGSRQSFHTTSSSASLATEVNAGNASNQSQLGDLLDRKIEALIKEWHSNSDLLFSIHPLDGSLLVWLIEWLDESSPSSFRQPQISFSARIPNAIPLGDAATMSHNIALYSPNFYLDLKSALLPNSSSHTSDLNSKDVNKTNGNKVESTPIQSSTVQTPTVCMLTKHINGSLNLWHLGFGEGSHFTQVLSISHTSRVCGHRFRVNDVNCHPVLPLLLTTSHHNLPGISPIIEGTPESSVNASPAVSPVSSDYHMKGLGLQNTGFCSELILWRVDPVGPLSKSGGVTELARINSLQLSAFSNVAWIPTLLPSTTLGSISNSPSACFVASDGNQLRIYQAVIDARTLLAEVSSAERKSRKGDISPSISDDSTSSETGQYKHVVRDSFKIVSLQSTARPGCILELNGISDAVHDWKNTQLLHVFQEQLIRGDSSVAYQSWNEKQKNQKGLADASLGAVVDLRHSAVFEEPFYLVVIEKNESQQSVLHMWRLLIGSQTQIDSNKYSYVPDSHLIQENSDHSNASSRSNSPDLNGKPETERLSQNQSHSHIVSPLRITTEKVCTQVLPLPPEVEVIHATPAAGHLSSSNIYPACFAPYLIVTACSDGKIRFWRCGSENDTTSPSQENEPNQKNIGYSWVEWKMLLNKEESSAFEVPGLPLYVSCSYSGRIACAYKQGQSFSRHGSHNQNKRFINVTLAIIECESTGGSEWMLEDTIQIKNIPLPQTDLNIGIDLGPLVDTTIRNKLTSTTLVNRLTSGGDEHTTEHRGTNNIQRLLSVPSYTTMQSLKRIISEKGNQFTLSQKSLVQLDWVSTEDGSHVLTVSAGSKITLFTPVSTDIAQANLQVMKTSEKTMNTPSNRMLLKQASSMAPLTRNDEIRWMTLRSTDLVTADGLPPLPMQLSWVRDGILVIGMDNEMLIYTQWKSSNTSESHESSIEITESRVLTERELLTHAQESSQLRLPSQLSTVPRSPSSSKLNSGLNSEHKKSSGAQSSHQPTEPEVSNISQLPDFGIFEASRLACPVLPQYHPKQLMELLAFGKIYRVRAILGHLVACLCSMNSMKNYLQYPQSLERKSDSERSPRSWLRSRTLSVAAPTSPHQQNSPLDTESFPIIAEEVQLDYTEITSIRPLPLYALIEADDRNEFQPKEKSLDEELDYDNLFDSNFKTQVEETLDEILGRSAFSFNTKPKKQSHNERDLTNFGQREARVLTKMLTHSHLPGLSSLDQMHLLALADSIASFNANAHKNAALDDMSGRDDSGTDSTPVVNSIVSADSLDNCGLRFLLTMRQHIYLLRCLPLVQRKSLQKEGLGTHNIVWAFHSETQEELVQMIPSIQKDGANWSELREIGVGFWIRNNALLRKLIERLAKAAFLKANDPLDAALFYLAMKKKSLVWGLFRSVSDRKMTEFFQNNFNDDKWRKAALKNAYALMGKQRFAHAAAFFLLAGSVWDAVEICLSKLDDLQLAMVIIRLYEGDIETIPENLRRLLFQEVLGRKSDGSDHRPSEAHPDPFLRSMAYWMLQDYSTALTTLLEIDVGSSHPKYSINECNSEGLNISPSVFNFYLYLRTQPLIVRRQIAQTVKEKKEQFQSSNLSRGLIHETTYGSDAITPFERRLFFLTAHSHFRAGCPSLALEVLSRLPNRIETSDRKESDSFSFDGSDKFETPKHIATGALPNGDIDAFDWGAPTTGLDSIDTSDFKFNVDPCSDDDEDSNGGLEMKVKDNSSEQQMMKQNSDKEIKLDIMAQQLKFIACLKIMMEELSTLATGFEVDGGQLRYQLYVWLEKSVQALKSICNYRTFSMRPMADKQTINSSMVLGNSTEISPSERFTPRGSHSEASGVTEPKPSLHEILLADKMDFEAKLDRSSRRKLWLTSNEALMRTLLSYCSLHGAHGGGLSLVRMELILLLQELQQERSQQQLLSPLPFPTTLPLLAASVACQKTVIADPIRHLQSVTHDILSTVLDMTSPPLTVTPNYSLIYVLRDLGISLSSCIYQSLCDSDAITAKPGMTTRDDLTSSVVCQNTHLLAGHQTVRRNISTASETIESLTPITAPNKWPGVQSLRALLARDKDEDSPKLHSLLCEAFVAIYLSQFIYSSAACDSYVLYRLIGMDFSEQTWAQLFGGGAKKLIHVAIGQTSGQTKLPTEAPAEEPENSSLDLFNTLSKQRMKLHMKILQQLSQTDKPIAPPNIKEDRPTYREQFIPPQTSMISYLLTKPTLPDELIHIDYDSSESIQSEEEDDNNYEFDELATTDNVFADSMAQKGSSGGVDEKKLEQELYAWAIIRFSSLKLAKHQLMHFLSIAGIEVPDLPTTSPLIHSILKILNNWENYMIEYMNEFNGPPQHFLPNTYVETSRQSGPAIHKYKALLELNNTPFRDHNPISKASKRLWNYLVRQERVQDVFVRFIFGKPKSIRTHVSDHESVNDSDANNPESARIVHKDHENISAFCINKTNPGFIAISTPKEIQEIDISMLLEPVPFFEDEAEYDILNLQKSPESLPLVDYLLVQHPADRLQSSPGGLAIQSSIISNTNISNPSAAQTQTAKNPIMAKHHFPGNTSPQFCQYILERSRHVLQPLKRHKTEGVRRLCSHPTLPLYLSGSQDGSVTLWEWNHQQPISNPRPAGTFAKVTRVGFNQQGNKFGVTDADGNLSLWQIASTQNKPFFSMQCHSRQTSDFTFLGASSLVMTAGQSTDHKNIALWDTLLPQKKCLVTSFACHEHNGASAILYAPVNQLLITGGKKGDVFVFDMRQRVQRDRFQAHDSAVKCMALDPSEEFFVTGSADGDIKVWGLGSVRILFYSFPGEHSRSTLFRNIGMGVSHLYVDQNGRLFSCGADGSMKLRQLPDRGINNIINTI